VIDNKREDGSGVARLRAAAPDRREVVREDILRAGFKLAVSRISAQPPVDAATGTPIRTADKRTHTQIGSSQVREAYHGQLVVAVIQSEITPPPSGV